MQYSLKQFSEKFGVSEHTVRYYTDIGILPCKRDSGNRRIFDEESVNWMQGIICLKGCGASIATITEYCELCKLPDSERSLKARYGIILQQRDEALKQLESAKATVEYMEHKVKHYQDILSGSAADDTNPDKWSEKTRPKPHK